MSVPPEPDRPAEAPRVGLPSALFVLVAGLIGLVAALALTVEKIKTLANPTYVPSCNLNPILACGSVMATPQATILGAPNSLAGVVAYTVVTVTGVLAVAKVALPRWYWVGLTVGTLAGAGFVHWLIYHSLYRIGALCPYCMVVWTITIPLLVVFASIATDSVRGHTILQFLYRWRWTLVALWFITLALLVFVRFESFWVTLV